MEVLFILNTTNVLNVQYNLRYTYTITMMSKSDESQYHQYECLVHFILSKTANLRQTFKYFST